MPDAVIVDAVRTPRGKKKGGFRETHPVDLAGTVLNAVIERNNFEAKEVEDVIFGCVSQAKEQGACIARGAVLAAGLPIETAGVTVNRFCGSGLQATNMAAQGIMSGMHDVMIGGGVENMTRVPMGSDAGPPARSLTKKYALVPQHMSADMMATKFEISREECDKYAAQSQARCKVAVDEGRFDKSLITVEGVDEEGNKIESSKDQHPRPGTTFEKLQSLNPNLGGKNSTHTAGSSSGIVDGASSVLLMSEEKVKDLGVKARAKIKSIGVAGSDPVLMLTGPVPSTQNALKRAGMEIGDIDLIEINEAFAVVPLYVMRELGMDPEKVNVNGGAIAMGHPLGATGGMLLGTVLDELERQDKNVGLITLCIGFGMGVTTIIERV